MLPMISQAQTLEECQQAAERNYPLIRQYDLISRTASLNVENIAKGWLPQVTASAQATLQSDVVSWPEQVKGMYQQLGIDMKGLRKDQYKIAVDVSQMVYDGGTIRSQKELALLQGAVEEAQTEVSMYQVRKQVNEMYFALLLLDEQIRLNSDLQELLSSNERKLASMLKRGTAAESDYNAVKAERLGVSQQATNLQSQRQSLLTLLSTFCGIQVSKVEKPAAVVPTQTQPTQRPELKLVQAQLSFADAQEKLLDASLKPRLSVFASGFYGYPGYNMFEDMMNRNWSLGGIIGARLSWNIGALYTRKNDKTKIQLQRDRAVNSREVFLFNNRLDMVRQQNDMDRHRIDNGFVVWCNEQALREIYAKAYEILVKEPTVTLKYLDDGATAYKETRACTALMSSFNRIGDVWCGASGALLNNVLRGEWGFLGTVITDYNGNAYMHVEAGVSNGNDLMLANETTLPTKFANVKDPSTLRVMRQACKNIFYTQVNSSTVNKTSDATVITYATSPWKIWLMEADIAVGVVVLALVAATIISKRRKKNIMVEK